MATECRMPLGAVPVAAPPAAGAAAVGGEAFFHLGLEVERDLRVARREGERDLGGGAREGGGPHQAERHDVAAEPGILHLLEMFFDGVGGHDGRKNWEPEGK
jgi:hypothetical protein